MKWIIYVTIFSGVGAFLLFLQAWKDGKEPIEGTFLNFDKSDFESGEIFQENDFVDDYSPENEISDFDRTLRLLSLKNKLDKIEEERETDDMNINYQNYK